MSSWKCTFMTISKCCFLNLLLKNFSIFNPVWHTINFDDFTVMKKPIQDSISDDSIHKNISLFWERLVRSYYRWFFLIPCSNKLKEPIRCVLIDRKIPNLINDKQSIFLYLRMIFSTLFSHQGSKINKICAHSLTCGFHSNGCSKMCFSYSWWAHKNSALWSGASFGNTFSPLVSGR